MEVRGEADLEEDEMQQDAKKVVYVLHPNCPVENFGVTNAEDAQMMDS
jgi:hypothetical protein